MIVVLAWFYGTLVLMFAFCWCRLCYLGVSVGFVWLGWVVASCVVFLLVTVCLVAIDWLCWLGLFCALCFAVWFCLWVVLNGCWLCYFVLLWLFCVCF